MKILAVGDVHTKTWIIDEVEKILDNYDHVVFCGDYADNWNAGTDRSMAAWRYMKLLTESNPDKVHALIGNHDYAYIHSQIAGQSSGWNSSTFVLLSAPENKKIKQWLLSLSPVLELDGVTFSHAGISRSWDGEFDVSSLWADNSPIWLRQGIDQYKNIPQVFGHTPQQTCLEIEPNIWCIDTFSEYQNNEPIGDYTALEVIDGKKFNKIKIGNKHDSYNSSSIIEGEVLEESTGFSYEPDQQVS